MDCLVFILDIYGCHRLYPFSLKGGNGGNEYFKTIVDRQRIRERSDCEWEKRDHENGMSESE